MTMYLMHIETKSDVEEHARTYLGLLEAETDTEARKQAHTKAKSLAPDAKPPWPMICVAAQGHVINLPTGGA